MKAFWRICIVWAGLLIFLMGCGSKNPRILIKSEFGDIEVEVYDKKAPITASNFLRYVDANAFEGGLFYRTVRMDNQLNDDVKIEVIQGGAKREFERFPPIEHETTDKTGVLHKNGVISMARSDPGSATSEFFICVGDQPELDFGGRRNPDGQGFATFGRVVRGMGVVRKIHRLSADGQRLDPSVKILNIVRVE
jgi:peptidyl-prolyl cis-trans isomerase A (cyclophilin A)